LSLMAPLRRHSADASALADVQPGRGCRPGTVTLARDWTFKVEGLYGLCQPPQQTMFGQWTLKSVLFRGRDLLEAPMTFGRQAFTDVQVMFTNRRTELEWRVTDERAEPARIRRARVSSRQRQVERSVAHAADLRASPANLTQTVRHRQVGEAIFRALSFLPGWSWASGVAHRCSLAFSTPDG
jgi:hypothetical protein